MFHRVRDNDRFEVRTVTLEDAVAEGLDVDVAAIRHAIGDDLAWRQEFCCEFVDESTSFMTHALIRGCQDVRLSTAVDWSRLKRRDADIYGGIDVGRYRDITAIWLWQRQGDTLVTRGVVALEAAPFSEQEEVIGRILGQPGVRRVCVDAGGLGLQLAERLAERFGEHRVEKVVFTAGLKSALAGELRVVAERGLLRIPVDDAIVNDWHSVTRMVSGVGNVRFDADRSAGSHADRFWAAALGIHAAGQPTGDAGLVTSGPLTFARQGVW
jgi:phage FluMu gp28-like protein